MRVNRLGGSFLGQEDIVEEEVTADSVLNPKNQKKNPWWSPN